MEVSVLFMFQQCLSSNLICPCGCYQGIRRIGCIAPLTLNLGTTGRWVINLPPWGNVPGIHWTGDWLFLALVWVHSRREKYLPLLRIKLWFLSYLAHSLITVPTVILAFSRKESRCCLAAGQRAMAVKMECWHLCQESNLVHRFID